MLLSYLEKWINSHRERESSPPERDRAQKAVRPPLDNCNLLITSLCLVWSCSHTRARWVESYVGWNIRITLHILVIKWEDWTTHCHLSVSIIHNTHTARKDYMCNMSFMFSHDDMLRSEPEFDPSSKEINILERRDASIAVIARLLLAQRSSVIDLLGFVYIMHNQSQRIEKCWKDKYCILIKSYQMFRGLFKFEPSIH